MTLEDLLLWTIYAAALSGRQKMENIGKVTRPSWQSDLRDLKRELWGRGMVL